MLSFHHIHRITWSCHSTIPTLHTDIDVAVDNGIYQIAINEIHSDFVIRTTFWCYHILSEFWVKCCMLIGHIACVTMNCGQHQLVHSPSISFRPQWDKTVPENYIRYLKTFPSKFCSLMFLFLYSMLYSHILLLFLIWLLFQYIPLLHSRQLVKYFRNIVNWCSGQVVVALTFFYPFSWSLLWPVDCVLFTASPNGKGRGNWHCSRKAD